MRQAQQRILSGRALRLRDALELAESVEAGRDENPAAWSVGDGRAPPFVDDSATPGRFARERINDGDQHTDNEQQDRGPFTLRRTE